MGDEHFDDDVDGPGADVDEEGGGAVFDVGEAAGAVALVGAGGVAGLGDFDAVAEEFDDVAFVLGEVEGEAGKPDFEEEGFHGRWVRGAG